MTDFNYDFNSAYGNQARLPFSPLLGSVGYANTNPLTNFGISNPQDISGYDFNLAGLAGQTGFDMSKSTGFMPLGLAQGSQQPGMFGQMGNWATQNGPLLNMGLSALSGINSFISGSKMLKENKRQFNQQMAFTQQQYDNERKLTNAALADRQQKRVNANSSFQNMEEYMKTYGV